VKLPAQRAGLPGKVISFYIVPLDPALWAGLAGHVPASIIYQYYLYEVLLTKSIHFLPPVSISFPLTSRVDILENSLRNSWTGKQIDRLKKL
jgi:hypothetical protein